MRSTASMISAFENETRSKIYFQTTCHYYNKVKNAFQGAVVKMLGALNIRWTVSRSQCLVLDMQTSRLCSRSFPFPRVCVYMLLLDQKGGVTFPIWRSIFVLLFISWLQWRNICNTSIGRHDLNFFTS